MAINGTERLTTRCPRCNGNVLRGECLQCAFDVTIDREALAAQIAQDMKRGSKTREVHPQALTRGGRWSRKVAK